MDIGIFDNYNDITHIFGICHIRVDGLDRLGITRGAADEQGRRSIHREGLSKQEAIDWISSWIEDGGNAEAFRIVATQRPVWGTVESGARSTFTSSAPLDG